MATAYLTLLLVIAHVLLSTSDEPVRSRLDYKLGTLVRQRLRLKPSDRWTPLIKRGVLMFSDQQLVTGIAILIAGYTQLPSGLSSGDWQNIVDLVWFSSITHLTTLTILQQYFWENLVSRWLRLALILALAVLQAVAIIPTGDYRWFFSQSSSYVLAVPTLCYFKLLDLASPSSLWFFFKYIHNLNMATSLIYLFLSYTTKTIKLSHSRSKFIREWLRVKPGSIYKNILMRLHRHSRLHQQQPFCIVAYKFLLIVFTTLRAIFDIVESTFWEVCFNYSYRRRHLMSFLSVASCLLH